MFCAPEILCKDVRNHFIRWCVLDPDAFILDMRANEVVTDVYVLGSIAVSSTTRECYGSYVVHIQERWRAVSHL